MSFKVSDHYKLRKLSLALLVLSVCIHGVYLADDGSENDEKPDDSGDSNSSKPSVSAHIHKSIEGIKNVMGKVPKNPPSALHGDKTMTDHIKKELAKDLTSEEDSDKPESATSALDVALAKFNKHIEKMPTKPHGAHMHAHDTGKIFGSKSVKEGLHLPVTTGVEEDVTDEPDVVPTTEVEEEEKSKEEEPSTAETHTEKLFVVQDSDGKICSLAKLEAVFDISAKNKTTVHLPQNADVKGSCDETDRWMEFSWAKSNFTLIFKMIDSIEMDQWALTGVEFKHHHEDVIITTAAKNVMLFKTGIGYSYACPSAEPIRLSGISDVTAVLSLKYIQFQPFGVKGGEFSQARRCDGDVSMEGSKESEEFRSETVPLAVGLTFAILTLVIVLGFSMHRAYTMRKVDYNGME